MSFLCVARCSSSWVHEEERVVNQRLVALVAPVFLRLSRWVSVTSIQNSTSVKVGIATQIRPLFVAVLKRIRYSYVLESAIQKAPVVSVSFAFDSVDKAPPAYWFLQ